MKWQVAIIVIAGILLGWLYVTVIDPRLGNDIVNWVKDNTKQ